MIKVHSSKKPEDTTIVVAMSGGVDSSVTAGLLREEGYKVAGVTLKLFEHENAYKAIKDAKAIADLLKIEHHVLNCEDSFKENVIDNFINTYLKGETPLPCARCNKKIKFGELLNFARESGADCMATGHYVQRIINENGKAEIHRAEDHIRDQSYFLFNLTQEQIDFSYFPIGNISKAVTREHAKRLGLGLEMASKPDSQDICFITGGDYAAYLKQNYPDLIKPGKIIHTDGTVLGKHNGIVNYTIGQRRGLGIGGGHNQNNNPFFVVDINVEKNEVIVGDYALLARNKVYIRETNWLVEIPETGLAATLRLRSSQKPQVATVFKDHVILQEPSFGVASGQACVCYLGEHLIGGGWISGSEMV